MLLVEFWICFVLICDVGEIDNFFLKIKCKGYFGYVDVMDDNMFGNIFEC